MRGLNPREETGKPLHSYLGRTGMQAIWVSVVDVYTAIAGPIACPKTLQRGPDGHICEFIFIDISQSCHSKAKAAVGEPRVPTQYVCQGEGSILQSAPTAQFPRKVCRQSSPDHPEAEKKQGNRPIVKPASGGPGPGAYPSIPMYCYISNREAQGPVAALPCPCWESLSKA